MIDDQLNSFNLERAKTQVYNVTRRGITITLRKPDERDSFGTSLSWIAQNFKAFPRRYTPLLRKYAKQVSFSDDVDVVCYISKKEADGLNLTIDELKSFNEMIVDNKTLTLSHVEFYKAFSNDFLYYVLGGKK